MLQRASTAGGRAHRARPRAQPDRPPGYCPGDPLPAQIVYLTFDDGPEPWTSDILDDGHALDSHTMTHLDLGHLPPDQIAHELDANHAEIERALGRPHQLVLIRPPFGSPWMTATEGAAVVGPVIAARGLNVLWSVNSGDALEWAPGERYETLDEWLAWRFPGGLVL